LSVTAGLFTLFTPSAAPVSAAVQDSPGRIAGKPDFNGIWEANNTANWNLQTHHARPMVPQPGLLPGSVILAAPVGRPESTRSFGLQKPFNVQGLKLRQAAALVENCFEVERILRLRSRPASSREPIELRIPLRELAKELDDQLP
jgi:hypothetical protein